MKRQVSERALSARLGRHLAKREQVLKKCSRQTRGFLQLGRYYTVSLRLNAILDKDIDLVELARAEGVLKDWEELGEMV